MAQLPDASALGARPTPQPSTAVASIQPGYVAQGMEVAGANLKQASQDFAQIRQSEIETQVNDDYVNKYIPAATAASQDFYAKQGKDAVAGMPTFISGLNDQRNKMRDSLEGTYAKQLFDQKASRHVEMEMESAARYADQQQKVYDVNTHGAVLKSYADQAANKAGDPTAFQFSLGGAQQEIEEFGQKHGQSADEIKQNYSDFRSKTTAQMLQTLALKDPASAYAMFNGTAENPGLSTVIDAQARAPLEHLLKTTADAQYARSDAPSFDTTLSLPDLRASEDDAYKTAVDTAEKRYPGNLVYQDQVLAETHKNFAQAMQVIEGRNYSNMSSVLDYTVNNGATSVTDLPGDLQQTYTQLTPQNIESVQRQFITNINKANGLYTKSDPKLVNDLRQRIYLPDSDPEKITNPGELTPYMAHGLNYSDSQHLRTEMAEANTPEGNPFLKQVNEVKTTAHKMLTSSMSSLSIQHPELSEEAAYRFGSDLDSQLSAYRAAGKDTHSLFTPGSPDYVLNPARVASFMPTEGQTAAAKAAAMAPAKTSAKVMPRNAGESPADYLKRMGGT